VNEPMKPDPFIKSYLDGFATSKPPPGPDEYDCAMCGERFFKGAAEEEAVQEYKDTFMDDYRPEECAVVCDDCWKKINPANHPHRVEESVAETLTARNKDQVSRE
jgi:hypothetical protein